jgi:hypothetical protein
MDCVALIPSAFVVLWEGRTCRHHPGTIRVPPFGARALNARSWCLLVAIVVLYRNTVLGDGKAQASVSKNHLCRVGNNFLKILLAESKPFGEDNRPVFR